MNVIYVFYFFKWIVWEVGFIMMEWIDGQYKVYEKFDYLWVMDVDLAIFKLL